MTAVVPGSYAEAVVVIAGAKARGARVLCGKECGREAELVLACANGTFQGVACRECWGVHEDFMAAADVFEASGLADSFCSRCGDQAPMSGHIVIEAI